MISKKKDNLFCMACQIIGACYAVCTTVFLLFLDYFDTIKHFSIFKVLVSLFRIEIVTFWYQTFKNGSLVRFFQYPWTANHWLGFAWSVLPPLLFLFAFMVTVILMRTVPWMALISASFLTIQSFVGFGSLLYNAGVMLIGLFNNTLPLQIIEYGNLLTFFSAFLSAISAFLMIMYFVRGIQHRKERANTEQKNINAEQINQA